MRFADQEVGVYIASTNELPAAPLTAGRYVPFRRCNSPKLMDYLIKDILADEAKKVLADRLPEETVQRIVDECVEVSGAALGQSYKKIDLGSFGQPSRSVHPRNLIVNWKKLFLELAPGSALVAASHVEEPWKLVLAALVVVSNVRKAVTVEINERASVILWQLWKYRSKAAMPSRGRFFDDLNGVLSASGRQPMSVAELREHLGYLNSLKCIELQPDGNIWLNDEITVPIEWR